MRITTSGSLPGLLSAANALLTGFAVFFMPIYFKEALHFSGTQIGALFAAYGVTALLVVLPSGLGTDAVTPRRLLLVASPLAFVAATGLSKVTSFPLVAASLLLVGVASHLVKVAAESFLYKTHDAAQTGRTFGFYQVLRMTGYCLAVIGGGYLAQTFGFETTVALLGTVVLAVGLATFLLPDVPVRWSGIEKYVADIRRFKVVAFVGLLFFFATHWGAETTSYALFLRENLHLSVVGIGWYMTGEFLTFMGANYAAGRLFDRGTDPIRLLRVGLVLAGLGHLGMTWPEVGPSFAGRLLHGVGDGCANLVMYVGIARLFRRERIGGNLGFVTFVTMAGQLTGALVFGPLGERAGYHVPFLISGAVLVVLGVLPFVHRGT